MKQCGDQVIPTNYWAPGSREGERCEWAPQEAINAQEEKDEQSEETKLDMAKQASRIVRDDLKMRQWKNPPAKLKSEPKLTSMTIQVDNGNSIVPYIVHGRIHKFDYDETQPPHRCRTHLVRQFHVKGLRLSLERKVRVSPGFRWGKGGADME
jgi:hypothetical protein